MSKDSDRNWSVLICLVLATATVAVFFQVSRFDFIGYDDPVYVYENPYIQSGITLSTIKWAFSSPYSSNWHPLTWLSHALDWQIFGFNAGGHHYTNLVLHTVNVLLLFIILKLMTRAIWPSAFVAALFALHPLHVESVAWVSERKDLLSMLFWLCTMGVYLLYVKRPGVIRYIPVLLFFLSGLMSKPMVITLPFVLLLLDYWPLGRFQDFSRRRLYRLIIEKVPLFVAAAASGMITFLAQRGSGAIMGLSGFPLRLRICNVFISYTGYIWKMIWPRRLAIFYPYISQDTAILRVVISAAVLLTITIFVLRFASGRRYLVTGWFWYLGTLLPVIGLVQVGRQAMADRYSYIPLTGLFIMIAWGVPELFGKWRRKNIALSVLAVLILSALSVVTYFQTSYWRNGETLFRHTLNVTKDNYMAHFCISGPLSEQGRFDEVIYHCSEALRIEPDFVNAIQGLACAHNNLGSKLCQEGRYDEAIEHFKQAVHIDPSNTETENNLKFALAELEKSRNKDTEAVQE